MSLKQLVILLPCYSLEDLSLERDGREAEEFLAGWSALFHPRLLDLAGGVPKWERADVPPAEPADSLIVVPGPSEGVLPGDWIAEAEAAARKLKAARLIVVGGTGGKVSATANALAALRAETVARRLESGGLPVKIDSYGVQARVYNAGGEDPEENRRVEIRIEQ